MYVQHQSGVWEHKVDFIVHADGVYNDEPVREQLGARAVNETQVELCCLPFYLYGYALGDILRVSVPDCIVQEVVQKSGRFIFRIMFWSEPERAVQIADHCKSEFGALFEWHSPQFCAVDIATSEQANRFWDYAKIQESDKVLDVETGY